jgi:DNA-binding transcriptional MocR family regulator
MAVTQLTARTLDGMLGDWRTSGPAYEALADRVRLLVLDGRVPMGARLPAERDLAEHLSLSRTTVTAAYRTLRETGFAQSQQGSGTLARLPASAPATHLAHSDAHGSGLLDFSKAAPPATALMQDAVRDAAADLPRHLGGTGYEPIGLPVLREAIARRYTERGLPTDAHQILVTVGAQQAIALIARTLLSRGDRALVETPTYPHAHETFAAAGARLVTVPVSTDTDDGWDVPALEAAVRRTSPVLAYVMPDFQNPTGRTMSVELRQRLLAVAASQGTVVVADETTGELDIDRAGEFLPIAAYGTPSTTGDLILIGSASKTMWGGLRIGWIRAEGTMVQRLASVRAGTDLGTPVLEQLIAAHLVPQTTRILEERRASMAAGREAVETALVRQFPDWSVPHVAGGLAAWVNIGTPMCSQLALASRTQGLLITAGPRFGVDGAFERFLRVPITYDTADVDRAVSALARAWSSLARHPLPDPAYLSSVV